MVVHIGLEITTSASFQPILASDSFAIEERVGTSDTLEPSDKDYKVCAVVQLVIYLCVFRTAIYNTIGREPETLQ